VVVVVGFTVVEPLADVDVNVPGVRSTFVAPVVAQLSVLLAPEAMVAGLATNEPMTGLPDALTVTVTVATLVPLVLVAVNV
jgi:hypothetical protein